MRRERKTAVLIGVLVLALGGIVSCDNNWMMDSLLGKKTVAVSKLSRNDTGRAGGKTGAFLNLNVMVEPADATNKEIKWTSSNSEVAVVMNVNGEAVTLYLAGAGDAKIRATAENGMFTEYDVHVDSTVVPVKSVSLTPESIPNGSVGWQYKVNAIVKPDNATDQRVIWSSEDQNKVSVIDGVVLLRSAGHTIITATTVDGGHQAECAIDAGWVPATGMTVADTLGEVGSAVSLNVAITPPNASLASLTWESQTPLVADFTDPAGGRLSLISVGTATIKVTAVNIGEDGQAGVPIESFCDVKVTDAGNLMVRFGATDTGKTGADLVTETFQRIHAYLNDPSTSWDLPRIHLGNFIDLPGLVVSADNGGGGQINLSAPPNSKVLRLIVVGINSFNKGTTGSPSYEGGVDTPVRHIVMQFNDCPGTHRMNQDPTNVGGYLGSEMRKYLRGENGGDITFPIGLENAGVPLNDNDIIFAPRRYVWKGYDEFGAAIITYPQCDTISGDKLWLPTEIEMFGTNSSSNGYETGFNQTRLMYYDGPNSKRLKAASTSTTISVWYWEASPRKNPDGFCRVLQGSGTADGYHADGTGGLAPAFCVK